MMVLNDWGNAYVENKIPSNGKINDIKKLIEMMASLTCGFDWSHIAVNNIDPVPLASDTVNALFIGFDAASLNYEALSGMLKALPNPDV